MEGSFLKTLKKCMKNHELGENC